MGLRVRQVEAAAQGMAELMVQRHANRAQDRAAEPGAVKSLAPCRGLRRIGHDPGRASFNARIPSTAIRDDTGLRSCA